MSLFIPTFRAFGRRFRVRAYSALSRSWQCWGNVLNYPEGNVYRLRVGRIMVVAMVDPLPDAE